MAVTSGPGDGHSCFVGHELVATLAAVVVSWPPPEAVSSPFVLGSPAPPPARARPPSGPDSRSALGVPFRACAKSSQRPGKVRGPGPGSGKKALTDRAVTKTIWRRRGRRMQQPRTEDGMTKSELIEAIAARGELTKARAELVVNCVFDAMTEALQHGEGIEIRGFGSFTVRPYKPYDGRNPRTGQPVPVPAKRLPFFKVGKELKELVNNSRGRAISGGDDNDTE